MKMVFSLEEKTILNPLKVEGKPNWKGKSQGRHQTQKPWRQKD